MSSTPKKVITVAKKSIFQRNILNLYAQFIRLSKTKPGLLPKVRSEFKQAAALPKDNILYLESKIRRANHQLDMLKKSNVTFIKEIKF
jgi:hypothetical protein